jgi:hypothetical protein
MKVRPVCLDADEAVELGELLEFLDRWLACDRERLAVSFSRFLGSAGYDIDELRADVSRFAFVLGGNDGGVFFDGDER